MSAQLFAPIPIGGFSANRPPQIDLYGLIRGGHVLLCEARTVLTQRAIEKLEWAGVKQLYARLDGTDMFGESSPLRTLLAVPDTDFSPVAKTGLVYQSAIHAAKLIYTTPTTPEALIAAREAAALVAVRLSDNRQSFRLLLDLMENDTLYTHAVNVCTYATAVGVQKGVAADELRDLSLGAFLHDIGKTQVPTEILDKPGKLGEDEWAMMRQHPVWGREIAESEAKGRPRITNIIAQHHERNDGSGYPFGLDGTLIDPLAAIVAVCDVYDALTSRRPYRQPQPPFEALGLMLKDVPKRLDPQVMTALVLALGSH